MVKEYSPMGLVASQNPPRSGTCDLMERVWALVLRRGRLIPTMKRKGDFERTGKDFKLKLTRNVAE